MTNKQKKSKANSDFFFLPPILQNHKQNKSEKGEKAVCHVCTCCLNLIHFILVFYGKRQA